MKKFYSLLAAGALFAGAAHAQVGQEAGTHDLAILPVWVKGMDVDNPQLDAKPGQTLKAVFNSESSLVPEESDFMILLILFVREETNNEIVGISLFSFFANFLYPCHGLW